MERCMEMVATVEEAGVGRDKTPDYLELQSSALDGTLLHDRFLVFIKPIVEYALGVHIGFAVGGVLGLWSGSLYAGYFEPVDKNSLSELLYWRSLPYQIAKAGAVVGVGAGIVMVAIIRKRIGLKKGDK